MWRLRGGHSPLATTDKSIRKTQQKETTHCWRLHMCCFTFRFSWHLWSLRNYVNTYANMWNPSPDPFPESWDHSDIKCLSHVRDTKDDDSQKNAIQGCRGWVWIAAGTIFQHVQPLCWLSQRLIFWKVMYDFTRVGRHDLIWAWLQWYPMIMILVNTP